MHYCARQEPFTQLVVATESPSPGDLCSRLPIWAFRLSLVATKKTFDPPEDPEPRWPALVAALAACGLYAGLPDYLAFGPYWLPALVVGVPAIGNAFLHGCGFRRTNVFVGHFVSATLTGLLLWSVGVLITGLPTHKEPPVQLLRSAAMLWGTNVLVFALWYWRLDAGGPHARDARAGHQTGAFLFPQMTLDGPAGDEAGGSQPWSPRFIDYLFLAFNTSTAFSPTDVPVLSRWAKVLVMMQATISLAAVVVLAGRAINIL